MAGQQQLVKQGAFDADLMNAINANALDAISKSATAAQTITSALTVTGGISNPASNNLTGNGNNQGNGTALVNGVNVIATCNANNNAFVLPKSAAGYNVTVINTTGTLALVFPVANDAIQGQAANTSLQLPAYTAYTFSAAAAGNWWAPQGTNLFALAAPQNNLTGNGNNQGNATAIIAPLAMIGTCNANNNGFVLPTSKPGLEVQVVNTTGNAALIFPVANDAIQGQAANAAWQLPPYSSSLFSAMAAGNWWLNPGNNTFNLNTGWASYTALGNAANSQNYTNGTVLTTQYCLIATGNANNNSCILPSGIAGMNIYVVNNSGATVTIFPLSGQQIKGLGASVGEPVGNNNSAIFSCLNTGNWGVVQSA